MSVTQDGWSTSPAGLACLDRDGRLVAANDTLARWSTGSPDASGADALVGRRIHELLSVGGRIYWETHVAPVLALAGTVDAVALDLRTPSGPLPVLLSARADGQGVDVAMLAVRERAEFEQELVRARAEADRSAARLRWVQDATTALTHASGVTQVRQALVASVARHPSVAAVELAPAHHPDVADARRRDDGRLVAVVGGASGPHGDLLVTTHDRAGDTGVDLDALATIARNGALALDRAHLHDQNASVAHELQHAMLTVDLPRHPAVHLDAHYRPAVRGLEVGGDWYDAFWLDTTTLAVVVGDVVGHGLVAAATMGQLRTATRALAAPGRGPAAVLDLVDRFVVDRQVGFGATLAYTELDLATGRLTYALAGHMPPLHVRPDGRCEYLWDGRSTPLGIPTPAPGRGQGALDLAPGEAVLLYTDGVVERRDKSLSEGLDELALAAVAHPVGALGLEIVEAGEDGRDDACLLAVTWVPRTGRAAGGAPS